MRLFERMKSWVQGLKRSTTEPERHTAPIVEMPEVSAGSIGPVPHMRSFNQSSWPARNPLFDSPEFIIEDTVLYLEWDEKRYVADLSTPIFNRLYAPLR
jgi:hypothetical protein